MITRRFGTHLPQRFTCQPGPQRQPTVSIGNGAVLGFAIGMACAPAVSTKVPAANAMGSKYLVSIRFVSLIHPYLRETEDRVEIRRSGMDHIFVSGRAFRPRSVSPAEAADGASRSLCRMTN
nr:hypothetical protein [Mesorhizobium silamurunense]